MKRIVIIFLLFLFSTGCSERKDVYNAIRGWKLDQITEDIRNKYIDESLSHNAVLPEEATNIIDLGNGWMTFDLRIKGRIRTFMYARFKSANSYAVPVCTELSSED